MDRHTGKIPKRSGFRRTILFGLLGGLCLAWLFLAQWSTSLAAPDLTIEIATWNVVGLDTTDINAGPDNFPVSARVCNTGASSAYNVTSSFIWDSANQWISLVGPSILTAPALPAGQCLDFTFHVQVTRNLNAINTARRYHITVDSDESDPISTRAPQEIFVKPLSPQNDLTIDALTGPTALEVGELYTYTLSATTSNRNYSQLEHFINFPNTAFRVQKIEAVYSNPPNTRSDRSYLDACGWEDDPTSTSYLQCVGPALVPGGVISGTFNVTYTVEVIAAGSYELTTGVYGYNNNTFVYNDDFGEDSLNVSASLILDEDNYLPIIIKNQPTTPTLTPTPSSTHTFTPTGTLFTPTVTNTGTPATATPTFTGTPPTPTSTGSITPNPGATKAVSPIEAGVGQNFTFTIRVLNNGSAPATNVKLEDSFSAYTYLDIYDLTTTKGTKNITGRLATVNIGTLNPGEVVIVRIVIRVNSTAPALATPCNVARITYGQAGSRNSNQLCFRVRGGSSLPPTGELATSPPETVPSWLLLVMMLSLGLTGVILLRLGFAFWEQRRAMARRLIGFGSLITTLALLSGLAACGLIDTTGAPSIETNLTVEPITVLSVTPSATTNPLARLPAYMFATPDPNEPIIIETLPSYPIPTPSITVTPGEGEGSPDTSAVVRMVIPKLDLDAKVAYVPFDGMTWMIQGLREEIAWLGNTSWPGLGSNTAFAGHVTIRGLGNGPFRFLNELGPGDEIKVYTEKKVYTYHVRELHIVEETEMWVTEPTEGSQITLITCVDWNETIGIYLKRLVVIADEVKVESVAY